MPFSLSIHIATYILVKDSGANGNVQGLGNRSRLDLTLFIQQVIQAFHEMPETHESKTPRDWVDRVEQLMRHFRGDHENCGIIERFGFKKTIFPKKRFSKKSNL